MITMKVTYDDKVKEDSDAGVLLKITMYLHTLIIK